VVRFSGGGELQYSDPRRFGLLFVHAADNPEALSEMLRLGEDPLGDGFVAAWLKSELARSRREIKAFLLDQEKIAGLGNIYACEALFRARLYPCRRCHTLDSREASALRRAIVAVLKAAIRNHGTSFSDFIDADGEPGSHQNFLRVFQREGERCRRCRAVIRRMKQANRSTYYCPGCQRRSQAPKRKGG
jgi:formamidopyrimidine-DNA glycosylase